jgi:uncharacterized SAM-binding protein YcdF (DUF218 family)
MEEKKHRLAWPLRALIILILLGIAAFGLLVGYICIQEGKVSREVTAIKEPYEAVIVLGAQVRPDGTPSVQLSWRLDAAAEAWQTRHVPVVVCGARGKDEPETEAAAMKRYLLDKGIPEDMILTDPESFNTDQNLENAKKLLDAYPTEIRKVLVVTSDYHVPRSLALARDQGLDATGLGSPCLPEYWLKNHGREALAWVKYWLNKYLKLNL